MSKASIRARAVSAAIVVALAACVMPQAAVTQVPAQAQQVVQITTLCRFDQGPRAGTSTTMAGVIGTTCDDGAGSRGVIMNRPTVHPGIDKAAAPPVTLPPPQPPQAAEPVQAPPVQTPPVQTPATPSATAALHMPPVGTRLFVPPDYLLPEGYGAVGVIAFRGAASTDVERSRRVLICQAYVTILIDAQVVLQQSPDTPQIVTLWPLDDLTKPWSIQPPPPGAALEGLCGAAVDHYAYLAGDRWLAHLPAEIRPPATRRGPFLIAWSPPSAQGDPNFPVMILDLTDFEQEATIAEAFAIWKDRIEAEPLLWSRGWDRTLLKLTLQATSDKFGGLVLAAFKLLPLVGN